jgi:hypothetical protein
MRNEMPKPRMTKSEKAFMDELRPIIWHKGATTLAESETYKQLPEAVRQAYLQLLITKTR